jgi:hypothetical protein
VWPLELALTVLGREVTMRRQMIREQVGEEWYEYVPLGKFVVSAPAVCRGRPTFQYTRIEVAGSSNASGRGTRSRR